MRIGLTVNGERREADVYGAESLLFVLRERLELPGAKGACEEGECGSCSVLLDGDLVCSCLVHGAQADGRTVVTVEGLAPDGGLHAVQRAFVAAGVRLVASTDSHDCKHVGAYNSVTSTLSAVFPGAA